MLKIILAILLIILLFFLINTFRKFFILQEIQNNINKYISSTNFHEKISINDNDTNRTTDIYKKGENTLVITNNNNTNAKTSLYYSNTGCDEFYETSDGKRAKLNSHGTLMESPIINYTKTANSWIRFMASIYTRIEKVELNGKVCYHITGNLKSAFAHTNSDEKEIYIEKDKGLCVKIVHNSGKTESLEYEFNNVTDEIFVKPDISQYELIEE